MHTGFSKNDTLTVKGVAILIMMWHHCFLAGRFENFNILTWPLSYGHFTTIASFFKICVSLFAFVSGYGLNLSCTGRDKTRDRLGFRWALTRYR